jgi:uroporphyrinogen-III decarboxylase
MTYEKLSLDEKERIRLAEWRISKAKNFEEADRVPVQIRVHNPFFTWVLGYTFYDYYRNWDVCRLVQIEGPKWAFRNLGDDRAPVPYDAWLNKIEEYPLPDVGSVGEGIVFECKIVLPEKERPWTTPWIIPKFKTLEDLDKLVVPDPKECEKRLREHIRRAYGKEIPLPRGMVPKIHPPLSAAGSLMGAETLFTFLYKHPNEMHKFLEKLYKTYCVLKDYEDDQRGRESRSLNLADDHAGYLNVDMYKKFVLPYNKRLYERYGREKRRLHMDSKSDHIAYIIVEEYKINEMDLGSSQFTDIAKIKKAFKDKVFFNGNLDTRLLVSGNEEEIRKSIEYCIYNAAERGGYAFDVGGETFANVDINKLKFAIEYAKKIGKYPIRTKNY